MKLFFKIFKYNFRSNIFLFNFAVIRINVEIKQKFKQILEKKIKEKIKKKKKKKIFGNENIIILQFIRLSSLLQNFLKKFGKKVFF